MATAQTRAQRPFFANDVQRRLAKVLLVILIFSAAVFMTLVIIDGKRPAETAHQGTVLAVTELRSTGDTVIIVNLETPFKGSSLLVETATRQVAKATPGSAITYWVRNRDGRPQLGLFDTEHSTSYKIVAILVGIVMAIAGIALGILLSHRATRAR